MAILLIVIFFGAMWALLIRPKQRELKRHNELVASLEVGDDVMIGAGVYGILTEVTDDTVWLEIAPGVTIKVARRAVASKVALDLVGDAGGTADDGHDASEPALDIRDAAPANVAEVETDPEADSDAHGGTDVDGDIGADDEADAGVDLTDAEARSEDGR